ncbi:hypothetical protein AAA448_06230 [Staphylococcus equorum]|uniref:hypothetical protein n=1 Tax=Staphylococcus equorum TaxID=246432 RepID=UPI003D808517
MLDSNKLAQEIDGVKFKYPYSTNNCCSLGLDLRFQVERYYLSIDRKNHELIIGYLFKLINEEYYWITLDYLKLPVEFEGLTENELMSLEKSRNLESEQQEPIASFTNFKEAQDCLKKDLQGKQEFDEFICYFNNSI